jgi:hypothetical protein
LLCNNSQVSQEIATICKATLVKLNNQVAYPTSNIATLSIAIPFYLSKDIDSSLRRICAIRRKILHYFVLRKVYFRVNVLYDLSELGRRGKGTSLWLLIIISTNLRQ